MEDGDEVKLISTMKKASRLMIIGNSEKFIDFFEELRLSGIQMNTLNVDGQWCEIDTIQDLEIAKKLFI